MNQKLYIILPVHNRRELTEAFVKSLQRQTLQGFHLVLIDDGSTDGTIDAVKKYINDFTCIRGNGDLWWGGSLHEGYKWLKENRIDPEAMVLLINDDTVIEDNYLETAVNILRNKNRALLLSENYDKDSLELIDVGFHINWKTLSITHQKKKDFVNCFSTRGLLLRMKDFMEIGGFHPVLLPHYLSDLEFTYRAYKKGFELLTNSNLKILSSEKTSGFRSFSDYKSFGKFIRHYLSKKNTTNPLHWISFIALSAPVRYVPKNVIKILKGSAITIAKHFYQIQFNRRLRTQA